LPRRHEPSPRGERLADAGQSSQLAGWTCSSPCSRTSRSRTRLSRGSGGTRSWTDSHRAAHPPILRPVAPQPTAGLLLHPLQLLRGQHVVHPVDEGGGERRAPGRPVRPFTFRGGRLGLAVPLLFGNLDEPVGGSLVQLLCLGKRPHFACSQSLELDG